MELSSKLASNSEDISGLFARMGSFEERLQKATSSPASVPSDPDLPTLAREFNKFKVLVWQVLSKLKAQTELLSLGQDRHETFMRRKILLFHGVTETKDEDAHQVVLNILTNKMQLTDVTLDDLQACHRLGSTTSKPRPLLVRFRDYELRRLAWDTKTELKDSGIVISEFLTKSRHDTFMAARKHFGIRNCWSADGKIVILLPDKTRKKIEVLSELQTLMAVYPAANDSRLAEKDSKPAEKDPKSAVPPVPKATAAKRTASVSNRNLRIRRT